MKCGTQWQAGWHLYLSHSLPAQFPILQHSEWELSMFFYLSEKKIKRTQKNPSFLLLQMKLGQRCTVIHLLAPTFDIFPLSQMPD